jgi:peptide deformylase
MVRPILRHGAPVLHEPARPVAAITPDIDRLIDDMIETMRAAPGVGLAAPQIGEPLRLFVVDLSVARRPGGVLVVVNPELCEWSGLQLEEEGCLSVPGFAATVPRPRRVVVRGLDREGRPVTHVGEGLLARVFQHEMDHVEGRLYLDRLGRVRRRLLLARIAFRRRRGRW